MGMSRSILDPIMSLEAIAVLNREVAEQAAKKHLTPFVPYGAEEANHWPPFPFPSLGQVPGGWEVTKQFLVDGTGFGSHSAPALTVEELREAVRRHILNHPDDGYAIIEEGPFQVIVAALRRTRRELSERLS